MLSQVPAGLPPAKIAAVCMGGLLWQLRTERKVSFRLPTACISTVQRLLYHGMWHPDSTGAGQLLAGLYAQNTVASAAATLGA